MAFAFLSNAKPLTSCRSEPRSAQGRATVTPQNVPRWGRSYKQPIHSELKLPLFILRGFNIVTCTAPSSHQDLPACPKLGAAAPQHPPPWNPSPCTPEGAAGWHLHHIETTLSYPAANQSLLKLSPHKPSLPLQGWRTKRVFEGSGGLSSFLLLEAW